MLEFGTDAEASAFLTEVKNDLETLTAETTFRDFNFPDKKEYIPVLASHHGLESFDNEFFSLGPHSAAFVLNPLNPGTISFGF